MEKIEIMDKEFEGFRIDFTNAPLLVIRGDKGFLACGYINMEVCNKLGDICGIVRGVSNFDEMLSAEVVDMSEKAREIVEGDVNGGEFLLKIYGT